MDLYTTIASWIGWPEIVATLLVAGAYAYFILNNRIEALKERNEKLIAENADLRDFTPDVVAKRLSDRSKILIEEIEVLNAEQKVSQEIIHSKEAELAKVKEQIDDFRDQIAEAEGLLRVVTEARLVCPYCGSPLQTREYHEDLVEYDGREIDVEHEMIRYECGYELIDGRVEVPCPERSKKTDGTGER